MTHIEDANNPGIQFESFAERAAAVCAVQAVQPEHPLVLPAADELAAGGNLLAELHSPEDAEPNTYHGEERELILSALTIVAVENSPFPHKHQAELMLGRQVALSRDEHRRYRKVRGGEAPRESGEPVFVPVVHVPAPHELVFNTLPHIRLLRGVKTALENALTARPLYDRPVRH